MINSYDDEAVLIVCWKNRFYRAAKIIEIWWEWRRELVEWNLKSRSSIWSCMQLFFKLDHLPCNNNQSFFHCSLIFFSALSTGKILATAAPVCARWWRDTCCLATALLQPTRIDEERAVHVHWLNKWALLFIVLCTRSLLPFGPSCSLARMTQLGIYKM